MRRGYSSYLALRALRVSVKELRNVGHDGLLIRAVHVNILWVKELGDPELRVSHQKGGLQPHSVAHMPHGLNVDQACRKRNFDQFSYFRNMNVFWHFWGRY